MKVIDSILTQSASIAAVRRDIHAHPELCFEEVRTADLVAAKLTEWGIPIERGMGTTGLVGIVKNGTSSRSTPSPMPANMPARCTPAAMTAILRCCWLQPSIWPKIAISMAPFT